MLYHSVRKRWNSEHKVAFALHHNKESTMDNSDGMSGPSSTPAEDTARRVKDAAGTVKDAARGALEGGKQIAGDAAAKGAERATSTAESTASALRRAAEDVEGDNRLIGTALRKSAESIERAAQSLQGGDISRAVDDLNGFARRQPALFLGASLALGFALARVGKTAIEQSTEGDVAGAARTPMPEI
jgi:hypothetical protein